MTTLFSAIQDLVPRCHGWCSVVKAQALAAAVLTLRPKVSVEIGVFGGRSLLPMALAHKETGIGTIIGIDPWSNSASAQGQLNPDDLSFWSTCDHEAIYRDFTERVQLTGTGDVINIIRSRSDDVRPPKVIDLAHLDGNHGEQALRDAKRFTPNIRVGGLCFLDDLDWSGGAVRKAEQFIQSIGFTMLYSMDTGAMYQRVKA